MADNEVKIKYRGKYFQVGRKDQKNNNFWIILVCVAIVISGFIFFIIPKGNKTSDTEETNATKNVNSKTRESGQTGKTTEKLIISDAPKISEDLKKQIAEIQKLYQNGEIINARDSALKILSNIDEDSPIWESVAAIIGKINSELMKNDIPAPEKKLYTVKKGDTLIGIASKHNSTVEAIQESNNLDPSSALIFPGKTLSIYFADWNVIVYKKRFRLNLYDGNNLFKSYKISIGKQGRTPLGVFEVKIKQKEPDWYFDNKVIKFGSKENILGTRWMSLAPVEGTDPNLKGYGIHGTWEPETIGKPVSNGCVRMLNEDIEELFRLLPYKTKVIIRE